MNIYLVSQDVNNDYDTFDSFICYAETEEDARSTHPYNDDWDGSSDSWGTWCNAEQVEVQLIGSTSKGVKAGVILASFNAG